MYSLYATDYSVRNAHLVSPPLWDLVLSKSGSTLLHQCSLSLGFEVCIGNIQTYIWIYAANYYIMYFEIYFTVILLEKITLILSLWDNFMVVRKPAGSFMEMLTLFKIPCFRTANTNDTLNRNSSSSFLWSIRRGLAYLVFANTAHRKSTLNELHWIQPDQFFQDLSFAK